MKKLLFSLSFLLIFFSCASDDDASGGNSIDERILGVWLLESILVDGVKDLDADELYYYKFEINGTITEYYPTTCYSEVGTFSFDGLALQSNLTEAYLFGAIDIEFVDDDTFTYQNIDEGKTVVSTYVRRSESELEEEFAGCDDEM